MPKFIYWVKLERSLFRKPEWSVKLNDQKIGLYKDREAALLDAVSEAQRGSPMGRASEVWVDEGVGFILHKAFVATKGSPPEEEDSDDYVESDDLEIM